MKRNYFMVLVVAMMFTATISTYLLSRDNDSKSDYLTKGMQSSLENSLVNFDKIDDAKISLVLTDDKKSVDVSLTVSETMDVEEIDKIVKFLSKSIENIQKENIQITDQNANVIYPVN